MNWLKHGRLNRKSFLLNIIVGAFAIMTVAVLLAMPTGVLDDNGSGIAGAIGTAVMVCGLVISWLYIFACMALRLHDIGHSGWFSLAIFVPFANFILLVVLLFSPGKDTERWGIREKTLQPIWQLSVARRQ